jgi:tRNA 5-methylaminomethyl-2-thiouridine biosynthesis bifunctional protein
MTTDLLQTQDGSWTLLCPHTQESYHSRLGACTEAQNLYIQGSGFHKQCQNTEYQNTAHEHSIHVLDVGLGLGYNACSTIHAWMDGSGSQHLILSSLEQNQALWDRMFAVAQAPVGTDWQKNWTSTWRAWVRGCTKGSGDVWSHQIPHPVGSGVCTWFIHLGDALGLGWASKLPTTLDFIWQDPFSPTKNPSLWGPEWFRALASHSHPTTRLMTYSVARSVKNALDEGGWSWAKIPGYGHKTSWLTAVLKNSIS